MKRPSILFGVVFFTAFLWTCSATAQSTGLVSAVPPDNVELSQGIQAALKGENDEAAKLFGDSMKKRPGSRPGGIDAAMAFADPSFEMQHFEKLRFWLEKTVEDFPDDPEAFFLLADIALSEKRLLESSLLTDQGMKRLEKFQGDVKRKHSLSTYGERLWADIAERRHRWNEAIRQLKKLHEMEPEQGEYLYRLGLAQFRNGQKDDAVESLGKAEAKDARLLPALIVLAQLADSDGNTENARKLLDEALQTHGENVRTLIAAAELEIKWNGLDKAKVHAEKAKRLDPESADVELTLGMLDLYDKEFKRAEEKFLRVANAMPNLPAALSGLALALCEQGDMNKTRRAFSLAKRNADRNPHSVDARTTLAWVLVQADAMDEAEKILMRQFNSGEMSSPAAYYMAVILAKRKREDDAVQFLRSALETKVNFPKRIEAEKLLDSLTNKKTENPESPAEELSPAQP